MSPVELDKHAVQTYPAGVQLLLEGDVVRVVSVVSAGFIKLTHRVQSVGNVVVGLRSAGYAVGASQAVTHERSWLTAETASDCTLHQIPVNHFCQLAECASTAGWVHRMQAIDNRQDIRRLAGFAVLSRRRRFEVLLREFIDSGYLKRCSDGYRLTIPLKRNDLAQMIGSTRECLSRLIGRLERERIVARRKGWLVIPRDSVLLRTSAGRLTSRSHPS